MKKSNPGGKAKVKAAGKEMATNSVSAKPAGVEKAEAASVGNAEAEPEKKAVPAADGGEAKAASVGNAEAEPEKEAVPATDGGKAKTCPGPGCACPKTQTTLLFQVARRVRVRFQRM